MAETGTVLTLAGVAAVSGFAWLALAMKAHWHQVHRAEAQKRTTRIVLRTLGVTGLTTSGVLCFFADRPAMAALVWVMLLAAAAFLVVLTLAYRPRVLWFFWPAPSSGMRQPERAGAAIAEPPGGATGDS